MKRIGFSRAFCIFTVITAMTAFFLQTPSASFAEGVRQDSQTEAEEPQTLLYEDIPVSQFRVSGLSPDTDTGLDYTDWWYSEWEDCRYVFLPASADRSRLCITFEAEDELCLDGVPLVSGETTSVLDEWNSYDITVGGRDCGTLRIMQSELGCIFLSTQSGGLDALDKNRNITETGTVLMLDSDGSVEYSGAIEKLTARGNSSWDYSKKKPYNLKLPVKTDLYGMGKAKKWALLSNYLDHSMIRNKAAEEMCRAAGMEYVLDSVFVDLYADGSYRGTYQLYERVQIQKNRVNIRDLEEETEALNSGRLEDYPRKTEGASKLNEYIENSCKYYDIPNDPEDITGGYLMEFQQWNRYGTKAKSGFVTSRGQAVDLKSPECASKAQTEYIRSFVQDAEDAIYSETGYNSKGKHYSEYIDVESLALAYLVQEITLNPDGTFTSFFLWKDSDLTGDGKLHFGPPWDFDLCYNSFATSRANSDGKIGYSAKYNNLYTAYFPINGYDNGGIAYSLVSGRPVAGRSWVGELYTHDDFAALAAELYYERFEPFMDRLTDGESPYMAELAESIRQSAEMSNARWHTYGGKDYCVFGASSGADYMGSVEIVRSFAERRKNWLSSFWSEYKYIRGDVNGDGSFNVADALLLQRWLLAAPDSELAKWRAGDMCGDGVLDVFDLCTMKRELIMQEK